MQFTKTGISGLTIIDIERSLDERGMFARLWCQKEFEKAGLSTQVAQCSISYSTSMATLRGMHYQIAPHMETKIVRCTQGSIFDVVIDLRLNSPTYKQWLGFMLSAENHRMLYIPDGFAHGLITLEPNTEVLYQISKPHAPEAARGVRWNDPSFNIEWPIQPLVIASRDAAYPNFVY